MHMAMTGIWEDRLVQGLELAQPHVCCILWARISHKGSSNGEKLDLTLGKRSIKVILYMAWIQRRINK